MRKFKRSRFRVLYLFPSSVPSPFVHVILDKHKGLLMWPEHYCFYESAQKHLKNMLSFCLFIKKKQNKTIGSIIITINIKQFQHLRITITHAKVSEYRAIIITYVHIY